MFEEGNILYFKPFYFKNKNIPKNKFFIVLKTTEEGNILASLPTKINHIPNGSEKDAGCNRYI